MDDRAAITTEWKDLLEVLHALGNMITVRAHYSPGHPAITQADQAACTGFTRLSERIPELVVAIVDDEFVICERPLPELRSRLHVLADAMKRHFIECIVFQRGMTPSECTALGQALALPADQAGVVRERVQQSLLHVLLRFVVLRDEDGKGLGASDAYFVPVVQSLLVDLANALATDGPVDRLGILAVANQMLVTATARGVGLAQRSWSRTMEDEAAHATNVAMLTAMLSIEAGYSNRVCIDATAAALVHDVGHLLLPADIRGIPEPLLDDRAVPVFRNHTFAGASMLLGAGCSPLWVAAALEHHRGVDGEGYPALESKAPPHELVRIIGVANFFDRKRTLLQGRADTPEDVLLQIRHLEERYFGVGMLKRFMRALGVFPPGTTVELSNRQPAVVTRSNVVDAWRPQVRILRGPAAGKHVELRTMSAMENRHDLSIVRSILPPLLVEADVVTVPIVDDQISIETPSIKPPPTKVAAPAGPTTADVARAQLGGMEAMLDALLTVSTDALVAPPPRITSAAPPAYSAPPRQYVPAPSSAPVKPPSVSMPIPSYVPPVIATVPSAPPPVVRAAVPPAAPPPVSAAPPPETKLPSHMPPPNRAPSRPPREEIEPLPPPAAGALPSHMPKAPSGMNRAPIVASRPPPTAGARPAAPAPAPRRVTLTPQSIPYVLVENAPGLDPFVAFVVSLMDGATTLADVIDASGMPQEDVVKISMDLLGRGIIAIK